MGSARLESPQGARAGLADFSDFYQFPYRQDLAIIRASRAFRQEALPFAYRQTSFFLAGLETATFLLSIGNVGRHNVVCVIAGPPYPFPPGSNFDAEENAEANKVRGDLIRLCPRLDSRRLALMLAETWLIHHGSVDRGIPRGIPHPYI